MLMFVKPLPHNCTYDEPFMEVCAKDMTLAPVKCGPQAVSSITWVVVGRRKQGSTFVPMLSSAVSNLDMSSELASNTFFSAGVSWNGTKGAGRATVAGECDITNTPTPFWTSNGYLFS